MESRHRHQQHVERLHQLHNDVAKWFFTFAQIGDVVTYVNTDGTEMPSWDGLGDWNVNWGQWTQGGLLA